MRNVGLPRVLGETATGVAPLMMSTVSPAYIRIDPRTRLRLDQ